MWDIVQRIGVEELGEKIAGRRRAKQKFTGEVL